MSLKEISLEEVKQHNDDNSVWIVINNDIYDITAYLLEHPGGEEVLLKEAGKDGTRAFEDASHSSDAKEIMVKFKIGTLPANERISNLPRYGNPSNKSSCKLWIWPVVLGVVITVSYQLFIKRRIWI